MKKVVLMAAVLFTALAFSSCGKEDDKEKENGGNGNTTVAEDKANIRASFDRMENLIQNFRDGNFYSFAEEFLGAGTHDGWDYSWAGEGNGDYIWVSGEWQHTPGNGDYELVVEYDYYWAGEGYGDYSLVDDEYVYTPDAGDYYRYEYTNHNWVGNGKGDYSYIDSHYEASSNGDYKRESYTYYDFVVPEFTRLLGEEFVDIINLDDVSDNNRFRMATFAGNYIWNKQAQRWDKTSGNDILVKFPSKESNSQNCELGITKYTDQKCDIEGTEMYLPTKISAYFNKDNTKIVGVEAEAAYTGYGIPKTVSASVYAKPVTLATTLKQETASKFSATLSISDEKDSKNTLSISAEAALSKTVDNYSSFTDLEINNLKISLKQAELLIVGSLDLKTLNNINDPSAKDINACLNLEVFWNDNKTGTLRVQEVGGDFYLFIVYKDDSRENTSIYYDDFLIDIENIFMNK